MSSDKKPDVRRDLETSRGLLHFTVYKLMEEIQKYPVIWDKKDPNYKKEENTTKAWYNIARGFVSYFDELDEDEQASISDVLTKRWNSCVHRLMNSVLQLRKDDPKYRVYTYAKQMEFYLPQRGLTFEELCDEQDIDSLGEISIKKEEEQEFEVDESQMQSSIEVSEDRQEEEKYTEEKEETVDEQDSSDKNDISKGKKRKLDINPPFRSARLRQRQSEVEASNKNDDNTTAPTNLKTKGKNTKEKQKSTGPNNNSVISPKKSQRTPKKKLADDDELESDDEDKIDSTEENHEPEKEVPRQKQKTHQTQINPSVIASSPANKFTKNFVNDSDEADQAFFESIKPTVNKLNEAQKLDFKIDILQILRAFRSD